MIQLILGGARSGKSSYAEHLATISTKHVTYIATATAGDKGMQQRIAHHRQSRPSTWTTVEEPFDLAKLITDASVKKPAMTGTAQVEPDSLLLIDCMTLWLSNWLCNENLERWRDQRDAFLSALEQSQQEQPEKDIIIVSNEVGSGIVPMGELSRNFADEAGWLNQALAKVASRAVLVVAGCPLTLKSAPGQD
ncbi:MAG: bifunctional adenosylcobinamide kinase/adenosylcobinamide-phosphate guanylyltransferase [Pseudomonadales bacterium]|nr:bifunctional adenosylcobinamide kinase/adenosylcobinamide-phosphate guanylyltransferase [Pseudomonadales bacterium]